MSVHLSHTHGIRELEAFELVFPGRAARESTCSCGRQRKFAGVAVGFAPCGPCSRAAKTRGKPTWNAGLTKETNASVASTSAKLHERYSTIGTHAAGWSKRPGAEERKRKISEARRGKPLSAAHRAALLQSHGIGPTNGAERFAVRGFQLLDSWQHTQARVSVACTSCNFKQLKSLHAVEHGSKCTRCLPVGKTSAWQREVADWVRSLGLNVVENDRAVLSGLEIDVWVPSKRVGIECHGLWWHSEQAGRFEPDHCDRKAAAASAAGITLVQIFDDEWREKREIVQSLVLHRLNLTPRRIGARSTTVQRAAWSEVRALYDRWHADGAGAPGTASWILKTKSGEPVAALTVGRARGSWRAATEVKRFATALQTSVTGGLRKLLAAAQRDGFAELCAYADGRHGRNGASYGAVGFSRVGRTKPRFWWTDGSCRLDRFAVRAMDGEPEWSVAAKQGVWRVYGCGSEKFEIAQR